MMFFGWVLIVVLEILLVDYVLSLICQKLNVMLFSDCMKVGYNVIEVNLNRIEVEFFGLIVIMQSKFKNCFLLLSLMICLVQFL